MKQFRYVILDPTGNLTCLVLDPVSAADRPAVTAALMDRCEQVGYLEQPRFSSAQARLEMMGGEFCGNASMGTACYLAREAGVQEETSLTLEVSGTAWPMLCSVRPGKDGSFYGAVTMPPIRRVRSAEGLPFPAVAVEMEGITHVILEDVSLPREEAETLLRRIADRLPAPALGLLQWDSAAGFMTPLVLVPESGTLVWESGCGSGSTALGAFLALKSGKRLTRSRIRQPGGTLCAEAICEDGAVQSVTLSGLVRVGKTETLLLSAG